MESFKKKTINNPDNKAWIILISNADFCPFDKPNIREFEDMEIPAKEPV